MAYDERLAERVRSLLKGHPALVERKMFGGLAYMSQGKMFVGILNDDLVVRVGADGHDAALKEPHTRPMDFTGKPMRGYIYVGPGGVKTGSQLRTWLSKGLTFVAGVPPKKRKPARSTSTTVHHNRRRTS
ncbi:TfoX/Sxy family protein [Nitrospira moscoviensis]|nr:TfoX/Sxy family protein [Nitrospira moscoviensis]